MVNCKHEVSHKNAVITKTFSELFPTSRVTPPPKEEWFRPSLLPHLPFFGQGFPFFDIGAIIFFIHLLQEFTNLTFFLFFHFHAATSFLSGTLGNTEPPFSQGSISSSEETFRQGLPCTLTASFSKAGRFIPDHCGAISSRCFFG